MSELILEVLDNFWNRKALSRQLVAATITEELGTVGDGSVTISKDDPVINYLPDPDQVNPYEGRWRLYEDGALQFAGVIDTRTYNISTDGNFSFDGKQRGIELSFYNFGRRDLNGWPLHEAFPEFLRDNIGKAPMASINHVSSENDQFPALNAITGDPYKFGEWIADATGSQDIVVDLGKQKLITAIRVIPPWWDGRWYKWEVFTSPDKTTYTSQGSKTDTLPSSDRGKLLDGLSVTARYVKIVVSDSTDHYARLASLMVYTDVATVGADTTYAIPFIENDDSGNIVYTGAHSRPVTNGAFTGDGIVGSSFVTQLSGSAYATHRFKGTAESVYLTQADDGAATVEVFIDGASQGNFTVGLDATNAYQEKAFEVTGLTDSWHTCKVLQVSGSPNIDYFTGAYETSWRTLREDDPSIGYLGTWTAVSGSHYWNYAVNRASIVGALYNFEFYGDRIDIIGSKGPNYGSMDVYMDNTLDTTVTLSNGSDIYKQVLYTWSGSYGAHTLRAVNAESKFMDIDRLQGNFAHIIYQRSAYDHNLAMASNFSEIINAYLRFNADGSIDLLGTVGDNIDVVIREGENEGGQIMAATVSNDYKETFSAAIGLVNGPNDLPIKSFVIDKPTADRIGLKIGKFDGSDSVDAFLLTRQTWTWLQDRKNPKPAYEFTVDESVSGVSPGDSPRFYAPSVEVNDKRLRIGRKTTDWTNDG